VPQIPFILSSRAAVAGEGSAVRIFCSLFSCFRTCPLILVILSEDAPKGRASESKDLHSFTSSQGSFGDVRRARFASGHGFQPCRKAVLFCHHEPAVAGEGSAVRIFCSLFSCFRTCPLILVILSEDAPKGRASESKDLHSFTSSQGSFGDVRRQNSRQGTAFSRAANPFYFVITRRL
jgi:hypothetical protein